MRTEWNGKAEVLEDFDIESFGYGLCFVKRKSDGQRGVLDFNHNPRVYFNFQPI
jgi:hypothetical protein